MKLFRERLSHAKPQIGLLCMYPAAGIIERIGPDWDWIWIDVQHGELGYQDMLAMVRACNFVQRPAFVRVPGHEAGFIGKALDCAAAGIIAPCVDTPEQARIVVDAAKFPPLGKRSFGARRAIDLYGRGYAETANNDTMLIVQIETPEAIENIDDIASVKGVDALFLGPDDLFMRRGYLMDKTISPKIIEKDMDIVAQACKKNKKNGVIPAVNEEIIKMAYAKGFQMIVCGADMSFLANGSKDASKKARMAVEG